METYSISTGRSRLEQEWKVKQVTWESITQRLSQVRRTAETIKEYQAMSRTDKGKLKDVGGFVGGTIEGGQRKAGNIVSRSLVTLDIDFGTADTLGIVEDMMAGTAWCLYSTHSHSSATPRYRLIVPLSRNVTPDEYIPIARRLAETIGIDIFDDSTYQPERLMYWPSAAQDGEFVFRSGDGEPADVENILASYTDWRDVSEWPVSKRVQRLAQSHGNKQEDPTLKPGIIGAFCRAYSISEAIETFLPDVYEPTSKEDRYTFIGGTTEAGAVVYEDKYLYSHHGTDPCCEREVNAFDLVRIHKYGHLDAQSVQDTPVNKLPSFVEMERFAREDRKVNGVIVREKLASLDSDFADVGKMDEDSDDSWKELLKVGKNGLLATPANYSLLLRNDPGLRDAVRHDSFRGRNVLTRDLPWRKKESNPFWENSDDANLIGYVSRCYGGSAITKTVLLDEWDAVISQNSFHPVRDFLNSLPEWDGISRLDTLLVDYLGATDCALTRAMTRKHFTAAVARIFEPGIKYDYVLTLTGPEGVGKSTLIKSLAGEWFDDSFSTGSIGDKEAMEHVQGRWCIEMGELKDYKKSTVEAFKAFISKQEDAYRPAYGRKTEIYRRQCVFFATTNERAFLKGDTGNRRFWAVEVMDDLPQKDVFNIDEATRQQIWAEAVKRYRDHEPLFLDPSMEREARIRQQEHNEITTDERIGIIDAGLRRHLPTTWWSLNRQQRRDFYKGAYMDDNEPYLRRETICVAEVQEEFFGAQADRYKNREIAQILRGMGLEEIGVTRNKDDREYGVQRRFKIPDTFWSIN